MAQSKPPSCCYCCHVGIGTIIYSLMILVTSLFMIVVASLALTGLLTEENIDSMQLRFTGSSSDLSPYQTFWVVFANGFFFFSISAMCIYGVVKNRAGFILPLFIVQLFDFLCTMVYMGSILFYWPDVKARILECAHMPKELKDMLVAIDDRWLACIMFLLLFVTIFVKSYLISMVYQCYKYITLQVIMQRGGTEINHVSGHEAEKSYAVHVYNPPKYEDILKVPLVDDVEQVDLKPPPYPEA